MLCIPNLGLSSLTMYIVCHRQSTEGFTSQLSFQQIKKVILHASWRSRYIIYTMAFNSNAAASIGSTLVILEEQSSSDDTCSHGEGITYDDFSKRRLAAKQHIAGFALPWETINMVLCLEIRKISLTIWKDVPSLTIFSNSVFIFLIGQLQIIASALQEMWISSFRTNSQRLSKVLSDQWMSTGIIPNSFSHVQCQ